MPQRRSLSSAARIGLVAACCCLVCASLLALTGCSGGTQAAKPSPGSAEASAPVGVGMGGPPIDVNVSRAVLDAKPKPVDLKTPESAVRSYLDSTSYAFRIGISDVATPTMTGSEEVRVDSYIQINLQRERVIDQKLMSITFGKPSAGTTSTLVPAKEKWTYSYLSIAAGNELLSGPFTVRYDTTYTVVKDSNGVWLVDSVKATPLDTVK
jgi:hypothetical protein